MADQKPETDSETRLNADLRISAPLVTANLAAQNNQRPAENIILGIILRLAAVIAISGMFLFVKLASENGVHVVESLFWRQLTAIPLVLIWFSYSGQLRSIKTKKPGGHALRMGLGISAMGLNFMAFALLPMAEATVIGFASPVFGTILAAIILREPTGIYRWCGVLVGFIGIIIVVQPSTIIALFNGDSAVAPIIALAGALITAAVSIQIRQLGKTENSGTIVFWFSITSMIPLGMAMLFYGSNHAANIWIYIAALSICGASAQLLLTAAMRFAPVSVVMTMDYTALIWTTLFGYLIFNDVVSPSTWMGAPIIIGAGLFIAYRERNRSR